MGAKGLAVVVRPTGKGDMSSSPLLVDACPVGVTEPKESDDKSMPPIPPIPQLPPLSLLLLVVPRAASAGEENVRVRLKLVPLPGRLPTTPGEDSVLARLKSTLPPSASPPHAAAVAPTPDAVASTCNKPDKNPGEADVSVTVLARRYRLPLLLHVVVLPVVLPRSPSLVPSSRSGSLRNGEGGTGENKLSSSLHRSCC